LLSHSLAQPDHNRLSHQDQQSQARSPRLIISPAHPASPPSPFVLQVSAVEALEGPLLQVEGLGDLRLELHSRKLNIHLVLIDELHRHLYIKSTSRLGHRNRDKNHGQPRAPG